MNKRFNCNSGLTLIEVLVSAVILMIAFVGILITYIRCMELNEMAINTSKAMIGSKARLEQVNNTDFNLIFNSYHNVTFAVSGLNGVGVSYVENSNPSLLEVTVSYAWAQKRGRIVGEDKDLDGVLDTGEDLDGDGMLGSPVMLTTLIYDK